MSRTITRIALIIGIGFASLALSGCGFKPLYQNGASGVVSQKLSSINVPQQKSRTGQLVRNGLVEVISPVGRQAGQDYRLDLTSSDDINTIIDDDDDGVLRRTYSLKVKYSLVKLSTGHVINKGSSFSKVSYDRTDAAFSNVQAQKNAQKRAAKVISTDILTRLSAYFSSHNS